MTVLTKEATSKHIGYFDFLRLIAAFSVIFMHTAAELLRAGINFQWGLLNLCTSFAFTAVPLFLMMSGYLLLSSEKTADVTVLLKKRLPRLVLPLAAWTAVAAFRVLYLQGNLTPRTFLNMMVQACNDSIAIHFWYMYLLIALYVLSPILYGGLHSLDRKGHLYVAALIGLVTLQVMASAVLPDSLDRFVSFDLIGKLKIFSGHLCTFVLGYYLGNLKRKIPNFILMIAAAVLLSAITAGTYMLTVRSGVYTQTFQDQSGGFEVMLAACLFLLFKQNAKPARFFRVVPIVPLFLPIYLMHGVLLSAFQYADLYPNNILDTFGMTILNFALCFLTTKTAATIKPICYLITGMTYRDACQSCNWVYTYRTVRNWIKRRRAA